MRGSKDQAWGRPLPPHKPLEHTSAARSCMTLCALNTVCHASSSSILYGCLLN